MSYVLDASVAVAAARPTELSHAESFAFLQRVLFQRVPLILPPIFQVEVVSALVRSGSAADLAREFVASLLEPPNRVVTLGPKAARAAEGVAAQFRLRGADAIYVWLAMKTGATLVSLDGEQLSRTPIAVRPQFAR